MYMGNFYDDSAVIIILSFRVDNDESLTETQNKEWNPVIDWFNERYYKTTYTCMYTLIKASCYNIHVFVPDGRGLMDRIAAT